MTLDYCSEEEWERIQGYIEPDTNGGCWLWARATSAGGYGSTGLNHPPRKRNVHRLTYTRLVGEIPDGLQLDHLCRVPACCNPAHLEPVTRSENLRRAPAFNNSHCQRGHEFSPENTYRQKGDGQRVCKACKNQAVRRWIAEDPARREAKRLYMLSYNRRKRAAAKAVQ